VRKDDELNDKGMITSIGTIKNSSTSIEVETNPNLASFSAEEA
jgi:hypothetical protein